MSKPLHYHIRAYQLAQRLLQSCGQAETVEGRYILKCLGAKADRAQRKADAPPRSKSDQDWQKHRDAADEAFSQYIRFRDTKGGATLAERTGNCVTCEKPKRGNELQCGHWLSRKHFGTRWHDYNAGAQCPYCNSPTGGHGKPIEFESVIKMIRGNEWPDKLKAKAKFNQRKPTVMELKKITEEFRNKLETLKTREGLD